MLRLLGPALAQEPGASKPISVGALPAADGGVIFQVGALTAPLVAGLDALTVAWDHPIPLGSGAAVLRLLEPIHPKPTTYEALFDPPDPSGQVGFRFLSPTCLRVGSAFRPFPDPENLFRSLLARFNTCSPFPFPEDLAADLGRLRVLHYRLSTGAVQFPTRRLTGFTGRIAYGIPPDFPPQMACLAHALASFARYSGVGYCTHLGLGHVAPLEER